MATYGQCRGVDVDGGTKVSMACLRNCTFWSFYICKRQLEEVTKQIFIPDAPLTTLSTVHRGNAFLAATVSVNNNSFSTLFLYEFIKAMPETINAGRRNVHHLCPELAKCFFFLFFLNPNRNVIIKIKTSSFSGKHSLTHTSVCVK